MAEKPQISRIGAAAERVGQDVVDLQQMPRRTAPSGMRIDKANFRCPFDMDDATRNPMAVPVLAAPGDVVIFSEGMTHNACPVTNRSIHRSIFFNYMPAIGRDNLPFQRMSLYPDHVLERLSDEAELLTSAGYI